MTYKNLLETMFLENGTLIEYKSNVHVSGYNVFVNGEKVGALLYGDCRLAPQDREFVTMLKAEKGTRYHKSMDSAKDYVKTVYKGA